MTAEDIASDILAEAAEAWRPRPGYGRDDLTTAELLNGAIQHNLIGAHDIITMLESAAEQGRAYGQGEASPSVIAHEVDVPSGVIQVASNWPNEEEYAAGLRHRTYWPTQAVTTILRSHGIIVAD